MMRVLSPIYTLRLEIVDAVAPQQSFTGQGTIDPITGTLCLQTFPNPYKWHNALMGKSGCDEVLAAVKDALEKAGIPAQVSLERFEHR